MTKAIHDMDSGSGPGYKNYLRSWHKAGMTRKGRPLGYDLESILLLTFFSAAFRNDN